MMVAMKASSMVALKEYLMGFVLAVMSVAY
jgi:hypothetical protein